MVRTATYSRLTSGQQWHTGKVGVWFSPIYQKWGTGYQSL